MWWSGSCSSRRFSKFLGEGGEDCKVGLNIAAHHGAISHFDPGVSLEMICFPGNAIEELARDVPAAKHKVRGQALRETHKGEGGMAHHSVDRPLNSA